MIRPIVLFALLLAGCAAPAPKPVTVTQTVYVPFVVPPMLDKCKADPSLGDWTHESGVADYIAALKGAADDCRDTLAALVFAASQPMVQ